MWLRDEFYIICHPQDHPLSLLGLWQRARGYLWFFTVWNLLTGALIISDAAFYRYGHEPPTPLRELLAGLVFCLFGLGMMKLLISRVGVTSGR